MEGSAPVLAVRRDAFGTSTALQVPGVEAVVTPADAKRPTPQVTEGSDPTSAGRLSGPQEVDHAAFC